MNAWQQICLNYRYDKYSLDTTYNLLTTRIYLREAKDRFNCSIVHVHTPKTAGRYANTVMETLSQLVGSKYWSSLHHGCVCRGINPSRRRSHSGFDRDIEEACKNKSSVSFSIVRNPYDLLTSIHFDGPIGHHSINRQLKCKSGDFKSFITSYFNFNWNVKDFELGFRLYERQFLFYRPFDEYGNCLVDFFIRYEYIDEAFKMIYRMMGQEYIPDEKAKIDTKSSLKKRDYKYYWTPELIEYVEPYLCRQLKFFNYDFYGSLDTAPIINGNRFKYNPITDTILKM